MVRIKRDIYADCLDVVFVIRRPRSWGTVSLCPRDTFMFSQ
jgi:hypothetical protein